MTTHVQPAFSGGEMAEDVWGRVDLAKFLIGLARARNTLISVHGGAYNRPGSRFVAHCSDYSRRHRVIEFEFDVNQAFVLVFGHYTLRVIRLGAPITDLNPPAITNITQASPAVVTTAAAHGWSDGKEVYIGPGQAGGMVELENQYYRIANASGSTFSLYDHRGVAIDSTNYTAYSSGGQVQGIFELATPWPEEALQELGYEQEGDVVTLTHREYQTQDLRRVTNNNWTLTAFTTGTQVPSPTNLTSSASGSWQAVVTAVDEEGVQESLPSSTVTFTKPGAAVTFNWTAPAGITPAFYNLYVRSAGSGQFGFIGTTPTTSFVYTSAMLEPDFTDTPPVDTPRFNAEGKYPRTVTFNDQRQVFGGSKDEPTTFLGSQIAGYTNFNRNPAALRDSDSYSFTLVGRSNNAIRHLVSLDYLLVLTEGAEWVAYGENREGNLKPTAPPGLKERSFNGSSFVRPVVINDTVLYVQHHRSVVRDFAYTLESDNFSGTDLMVMAPHLVDGFQITDMAWQQVPSRSVWCVRSDGQMLTLAYMREQQIWAWSTQDTYEGEFESVCTVSEDPEDAVYVTVKRRSKTGQIVRYVERFASRDMLNPSALTQTEPGESKKKPDQRYAFFVDSGLTYDQPLAITNITAASPAVITAVGHTFADGATVALEAIRGDVETREVDALGELLNDRKFIARNPDTGAGTFELYEYDEPNGPVDTTGLTWKEGGVVREAVNRVTGLWHLEGEQVAVLGDANVVANGWDDEIPIVVTNGAVTLPNSHTIIHVGLPMESLLRTLPLPIAQGARKHVANLTTMLKDTRGIEAGLGEDLLAEWPQRYEEPWGAAVELFTGKAELSITSEWDTLVQMTVRQRNPLPMGVLSIIPDVESGY